MQRLPATRDSALHDLNRAISALSEHLHGPQDLDALSQLRSAAARLATPDGLAEFDAGRFRHLLTLAGPKLQGELLAQLTKDLTACADRLSAGQATNDWAALREGSHVLISLAGSVGALSLQSMAERLNTLANDRNPKGIAALMPATTSELEALLRIVRKAQVPANKANFP